MYKTSLSLRPAWSTYPPPGQQREREREIPIRVGINFKSLA